MKEYGSQSTDQARTPMLREWCKQQEGKIANLHLVKTIFNPGRGDNYGVITESGFRVNVYPTSPLYSFFRDELQEELTSDPSFFVRIDNSEKGQWSLVSQESTLCSWVATDWGYKVDRTYSPPAAKKSQRGNSSASHPTKVE